MKKNGNNTEGLKGETNMYIVSAIMSLMLAASMVLAPAMAVPPPMIDRPMQLKIAAAQGIGPETVDYSLAYDTASGEIIQNTMDTLITFDGEHTDRFLPGIARSLGWIPLETNKIHLSDGTVVDEEKTTPPDVTGKRVQNPDGTVTTTVTSETTTTKYRNTNNPDGTHKVEKQTTHTKTTTTKTSDANGKQVGPTKTTTETEEGEWQTVEEGPGWIMAVPPYPGIDSGLPKSALVFANPNNQTGPNATYYCRYVFEIRPNIFFQPPYNYLLTPEDVAASFQRTLIMDMANGPAWMLYQALLDQPGGAGALADLTNMTQVAEVGALIKNAVQYNNTDVWFNLMYPGAYAPFMQILTQTWSSIMSMQWINNQVIVGAGRYDWNGNWSDLTSWLDYHNPAVSPLDFPTPMIYGSGPFQLLTLDQTNSFWEMTRNVAYWRGWPADYPSIPGISPRGYFNDIYVTWADDWTTMKNKFLNGEIDICAVPRNETDLMGKPGIRCTWPLLSLAVNVFLYNYNIDPTTPYGQINDYGVFTENGIPRDFFSNPNIRKAFSHCIDFATFIQTSYLGEAIQPATAIIPGLPYYDASVQKYTYDLAKAKTFFEAVPNLMTTGFTITLTYNSGNTVRKNLYDLLKTAIESISPKFHVTVAAAAWPAYVYAQNHAQLTAFIASWLADYPDAHNFAYAFYYSLGDFAWRASYSNPDMDALIDAGIRTPDGADRAKIYSDIQKLVIDDCPCVPISQPVVRHFERDWVNGWYYNPSYPGVYAYNLWKWYYMPQASTTVPQLLNGLPCDVNYDGKVDILDIFIVANAFGSSYGPPIHPRWNFRADISNDRKIDILDVVAIAKNFMKTSPIWVPS
jgi:peptide/nickel transport system substrate-binding protein